MIGEKLTSAPVVSRRVLDCLGIREPWSMSPAAGRFSIQFPAHPQLAAARTRLRQRYGHRWTEVAALAVAADDSLLQPFADSPVLEVELLHAIQQEMAVTLADLVRRTGLGASGSPGAELLQALAAWTIRHAGWNAEGVAQEAAALDDWFASRQCRPEEHASS